MDNLLIGTILFKILNKEEIGEAIINQTIKYVQSNPECPLFLDVLAGISENKENDKQRTLEIVALQLISDLMEIYNDSRQEIVSDYYRKQMLENFINKVKE